MKLNIKLPDEIKDFSIDNKIKVVEEISKGIGLDVSVDFKGLKDDSRIWQRHSHPDIADLEDFFYETVSLPWWNTMLELFAYLDLDLPISERIEIKSFWEGVDLVKGRSWDESKHPRDAKGRFTNKFDRAVFGVGGNLAAIRRKYGRDLNQTGLGRDRTSATIVALIDRLCLRMGNEDSADVFDTFGATTLRKSHVEIEGNKIIFKYRGKKGVSQKKKIVSKPIADALREMMELDDNDRAKSVFKYINTQGEVRSPTPYVVNKYLEKYGITAKDFRTYHASRFVFQELKRLRKEMKGFDSKTAKEHVKEAVKITAEKLGHLPSTCKRKYIDPVIIEKYLSNKFRVDRWSKSVDDEEDNWQDLYEEIFAEYEFDEEDTKSLGFDILKGSNPWDKWLEWKKRGAGWRWPADGRPFTKGQLSNLERILNKYKIKTPYEFSEALSVKSGLVSKFIAGLDEKGAADMTRLFIEMLPDSFLKLRKKPVVLTENQAEKFGAPILQLTSQEEAEARYGMIHAAEHITNLDNKTRGQIKRMLLDGRRSRIPAPVMAQKLFESFGQLNRDWRRMAITENAMLSSNGYLITLENGETVVGRSAVDACPYCMKLIHGKVYNYRTSPGNKEREIWTGKTNVGRSRKDWTACIPLHPHCRCRWVKINTKFQKVDEKGNIVTKTRQELMYEAGITG